MAPPSGRRAFVDTLRKVAATHGLDFVALSSNWIIQFTDPESGRRCTVFGYTFDVNGAGAVEICKEKSGTSLVLGHHGIPNIQHSVFLNPGNEFTAEYIPKAGVWSDIQKLVAETGLPVVVKPLKGTGGLDVTKATCWREVEGAVQHIFGREYGLAISPYKKIKDEYRCICLDGKVELTYRKVRSHVIGNGSDNVAALLGRLLASTDPKALASLTKAAASLSNEELARTPAEGEAVALQWKHNLGAGASLCMDLRPEVTAQLSSLAPRAAGAIGMRFCSVDIVDVEGEGFMVMEVNSGVMMDSLIAQLGDKGMELAYKLYESAVLIALGKSQGKKRPRDD